MAREELFYIMQNTFQAIVITDNSTRSFAIFTYRCDEVQWPGLQPNFAKIGINFGSGMEEVHELSGQEVADDIDCLNNDTDDTGSNWVNVIYDLNTSSNTPPSLTTTIQPSASVIISSSISITAERTLTDATTTTLQPSPSNIGNVMCSQE